MPEPLKHLYNEAFFQQLTDVLFLEYPAFNTEHFLTLIFDKSWEEKELKQRMRHITQCLHQCLPEYEQAIPILKAAASHFQNTFEHMFFPDYVECYGLEDYEISVLALEHFTQYSSSEFAVRPFIIKYPEKMISQMKRWALHDSEHVRRLASEGCRPRLPWAMQLPAFIQDPKPVLEVLDTLKCDSSLYVRKSVANNLNDISKDHPKLVLAIARSWLGLGKDTDWLVKHACRSLLKQGSPDALTLFDFTPAEHIQIENFEVSPCVQWGENVTFSALLYSNQPLGKLRLEFAVGFKKANGKTSTKVFKISESDVKERRKVIRKSFSFKSISTRKYYAGKHDLKLIINGQPVAHKQFLLNST